MTIRVILITMTLGLFLVSAGVCVSILTGATLWAKNTKSMADRLYLLTSCIYILLGVSNYLSTLANSKKLLYARIVIILTCWSVFLTYVLIIWLSEKNVLSDIHKKKTTLYLGLYGGIIITALSLTPYIITKFEIVSAKAQYLRFGGAAIIFFGFVAMYSLLTLHMLYMHIRYSNEKNTRSKFGLLMIGFLPVVFIAPVTSIYLPMRYGNLDFIDITPLYSAFFVIMVGYAMVRHQLFDIRLYVVRFIAFLIASIALSIIYVAPIIYLFCLIVGLEVHLTHYILAIICFSVAAAYYHRLQDWFKNSTSRIFFQDVYDSADVLSYFNKTIANQVILKSILDAAQNIASNTFRANYSTFILEENTGKPRLHGDIFIDINNVNDLRQLTRCINNLPQSIILLNTLKDYPQAHTIAIMYDISVIAKVNLRGKGHSSNIAYWILGPKQSGASYTMQDIQVLEALTVTLAIAIKNALQYEEIQQFNKTLQGRVEEATRKLRASNERLKKLDETKDDFISMASHQLRTPLTSVKGYISMVLDGDAGRVNDAQRKMLGQAFMSSQRMVYLISDLLNLSRLNTGRFVIESKPVNLRSIVTDEVSQLHETAQARGVTLVYDLPETFPSLMLDETKIHQVVMNFIDNAVYYTPTGGKITVSLSETPTAVELKVIDTGIGVPRHEQPHLFTKFYRANNARQARPDGTGLGLFMAKKVIMAHGGVIIFDSAEGKGSTFGFRLKKQPLAAVETAIAPVAAVDPPMPIAKPPA